MNGPLMKNEEKTREDFYTEGGVRWFKSGDIGEMDKVIVGQFKLLIYDKIL